METYSSARFRQNGRRHRQATGSYFAASRNIGTKSQSKQECGCTIVESKVERGKGSVATVLVQHGTLYIGDIFVAGAEWGRVRALLNDKGERIDDCGPSFPAEVLG